MSETKIYVWADYSWCFKDDYNEAEFAWKSDDFVEVIIPEGVDLNTIDDYIISKKVQG